MKHAVGYEKHMEWKSNNPEKVKKHSKDYYEKNKDVVNNRNILRYRKRREYYLEKARLKTRKNKEALLDKFGRKCAICGYDKDIRALQIDHVNGGGTKQRKEFSSSLKYFKFLMEYKGNDFQVLCANCNWIKRYELKELNQYK